MDLSFFTEPPELEQKAILKVAALAPLSMVSAQPGSYFRSELAPTLDMIYGMLENALGWHFEEKTRRTLFKALQKVAKKKHGKKENYRNSDWLKGKSNHSGSGYFSFLQYHLSLFLERADEQPMTYDDLWSMHLRTQGDSFVGGSRNYDNSLENLISISRKRLRAEDGKELQPAITFGDKKDFVTLSLQKLRKLTEGKIKTTSLKPHFPHYYVSPKVRGYVVPKQHYFFRAECTKQLSQLLEKAIGNPSAPLYLGSNDGWVDVKWTNHES
jgi:CRISPR-associated protein Cas5